MATAVRRHAIVNPAGRHHRKKKNRARAKHRRNLSRAQIRAGFGGKRRKAALKVNRKRTISAGNPKRHHRVSAKKSHRSAARRRAPKRENPGEILSLTLGNPGGKRRSMAATKKHHRVHHKKNRVHHRRRNPGRRVMHHRHARRNPSAAGIMGLLTQGVFAAGGLVLSRFATQAVLGAQNTGFMGYAGNAVATGLLAWGTHMVSHNPRNRDAVILGGVMGIIARLITDFTPYGSFLQQQGFGDYGMGLYLQQNEPMPSRLVDPSGAIVEIPSPGWAPTVVAPAARGMGALYSGGGSGLYS